MSTKCELLRLINFDLCYIFPIMGRTGKRRLVVVGAGFGGLAAAALMARSGWEVTVLEKNSQTGGRARIWESRGYRFDMGPSWYLMPEVFESFFRLFGREREQFYSLVKLDPSYRIFFGPQQVVDIREDVEQVIRMFEGFEPGGGRKLRRYLELAEYKYDVAVREFLYRSYSSVLDFLNRRMIVDGLRLNVFGSLDRMVSRLFHDRRARQILEYAMVFLGTSPRDAPGLYSIMSHMDLSQGVSYPMGGLAAVAGAIHRLAESQGARILCDQNVGRIEVRDGRAGAVITDQGEFAADAVLVNADYAHAETELLEERYQSLRRRYWERRVVAPAMFILYLGLDRKLANLLHHNLYFAPDWDRHFDTIFRRPSWPSEPCFYVSCTSKTDPTMAPEGKENVFVLVPVAPDLEDTDEVRQRYAEQVLRHLEAVTGEEIRAHIEVQRIYSHRDFRADYNAYRGTALGLSHTLGQTAVFRPPYASRKVGNLFYAGQYTHPGIGVPMVLIAAQVVSGLLSGEGR
jgi:phytoene desaturase